MACCLTAPSHYPVLLKYGRPVAKCDPWIHWATQGPTIDGPFGDQWRFCRKYFRMKLDITIPEISCVHLYLCLNKTRTSIGSFWLFLIDFMVWADCWLTDHPELRRTTQPSPMGGPWGKPGFCIFHSTDYQNQYWAIIYIVQWFPTKYNQVPS